MFRSGNLPILSVCSCPNLISLKGRYAIKKIKGRKIIEKNIFSKLSNFILLLKCLIILVAEIFISKKNLFFGRCI